MTNFEIIFAVGMSVFGGLFTIFWYMYQRNEKNKDAKFDVLSEENKKSDFNQLKILNIITDVRISLTEVKQKASSNYADLQEFKGVVDTNFEHIHTRLDSQSKRSIKNEVSIAVIQSTQENCPARKK